MSIAIEKKVEGLSFLERYYSAQKDQGIARNVGEVVLRALPGLEKRFDVEIASGFSEALVGRVHAEYDFGAIDGRLVADDGEFIEDMLIRSRDISYKSVDEDPEMTFLAERSNAEIGELKLQQSMLLEGAGATLIKFSPMTFELAHRPDLLKKAHQRPELGRSMVRVSHWDGTRMHILTRSLDRSDLELLETTAEAVLGHVFEDQSSIGMLRDNILRQMTLEEARQLLDTLCETYEKALYLRTGLDSEQGALAPDNIDLLCFVESRPEILSNIKNEVKDFAPHCRSYIEFESQLNACLYRHLALYEELLRGRSYGSSTISESASGAGFRAMESGTTYSMCGYIVGSEIKSQISLQTGFEIINSDSERKQIVDKLTAEKRKGSCLSCGEGGDVFGCGLCAACNQIWCDEYVKYGRGLEIHEVSRRSGKLSKRAAKKATRAENKNIKKARNVLREQNNQKWEFFRKRR